MRKIVLRAVREYNAAVRTKAFIIMLVLMPVLMGGSLLATKIMEKHVDTTDKRIAVVDRSGVIAQFLVGAAEERNKAEVQEPETGKKIRPAYVIEVVPPNDANPDAQRLELSGRVKARELWAFVEIGKDVVEPGNDPQAAGIAYHSENALMDEAREWLVSPINNYLRGLRLGTAGLDAATVDRVTRWIPVEGLGLVTIDKATGEVKGAERSSMVLALALPMVVMMLMFMMIAMGATPLINSVMEEKMQRIAEVLLGSVGPFQLMMGKMVGTVAVSLTMVAVYVVGGVGGAAYMGWSSYIPYHILPWLGVYQVMAIFMFGALFIAVGAACNDLKEAQSLMMPVWLLVMVPMFVFQPVLKEPLSGFSTWMSLIPPFTPLLMLLRQTTPAGVPAWQPWVGLAGVFVFTIFCVWAAGRIFRIGILLQGQPPKVREILRWALRG